MWGFFSWLLAGCYEAFLCCVAVAMIGFVLLVACVVVFVDFSVDTCGVCGFQCRHTCCQE